VSHHPAALPEIALSARDHARESRALLTARQAGGPWVFLELAGVYWVVLRAVLTTELGASRRAAAAIVVEWLGVVVG
jgi:hypothetical protein